MPIITDLRLDVRGERRGAEFRLTGNITWGTEDLSRNGAVLLVTLRGQDPGHDDLIWNYAQWVTKGGSERVEAETSLWNFSSDGADLTRFELIVNNTDAPFWDRRFNEDRPGEDEVYAIAVLREINGAYISEGLRSNTVRGRF